ncbi:MAG: hypothetical protein DRG78_05550 [Epsilonproteobacteria bacterium]|nr:MAG: hypothetical protein DRG78_05550 [Campylobacterota bacterium]
MPSALIGNSIGQVFFQEATKEKQLTGKAIHSFSSTLKKLIIIGIPSFGVLFFIVEDLFAFIFGEDWRIAGVYAQVMVPVFFIRFISSTVSSINIVFEKQKIGLYINILLMFSSIIILYMSEIIMLDFTDFLSFLSIILTLEYSMFLYYYSKLSKGLSK